MVKERGVILPVWRAFVASLKPRRLRDKLVGEDYNGTKYYENPEAPPKRGRSFVTAEKDNFMQELPAEWEAWLRYRRRDPPTKEEINENVALIMTKKKNADELEKIRIAERAEKYGSEGEHRAAANAGTAFPTYKDYENFGQNYQPEEKK